jgi:cytidine deaminase
MTAELTNALRERLDAMGIVTGVVLGNQVSHLLSEFNIPDVETLMLALLPAAEAFARAPISNFRVGAIAKGMPTGSGAPNLYFGANHEFTGKTLSSTVHAEQAAVVNAWLNGETGIQAVAVSAAPCGHCRQFLHELSTASNLQILLPDETGGTIGSLSDYLPSPFGPANLGLTGGLMTPQNNALRMPASDVVIKAALDAANSCYAPYTRNYAGVALVCDEGTIYQGRYAENAAYNPSLSPLEAAITVMSMNRPPNAPLAINCAILVEKAGLVSQLGAATAVLASVAPTIQLEYYKA